jgi:hypothetical protein
MARIVMNLKKGREIINTVKKYLLLGLLVVISTSFHKMNIDEAYCAVNPVYLGEFCWDTSSGGFLRIGITHMGDRHLTFCGTVSQDLGDRAIHGNIEVIGDNAVISFTDAETFSGGTDMTARVGDAILDISTLDGTAHSMVMRWEDGVASLDHETEVLHSVECGTSPSPDVVDEREELKRILRTIATRE